MASGVAWRSNWYGESAERIRCMEGLLLAVVFAIVRRAVTAERDSGQLYQCWVDYRTTGPGAGSRVGGVRRLGRRQRSCGRAGGSLAASQHPHTVQAQPQPPGVAVTLSTRPRGGALVPYRGVATRRVVSGRISDQDSRHFERVRGPADTVGDSPERKAGRRKIRSAPAAARVVEESRTKGSAAWPATEYTTARGAPR